MGACGSTSGPAAVSRTSDKVSRSTPLEDLSAEADEANPLAMARKPTSCRVCCTDRDSRTTAFLEKKVKNSASIDSICLGTSCRKGKKPCNAKPMPNQDAWSVLLAPNSCRRIYGVFDGHGEMGHEASDLAKETMPKLIARDNCDSEDLKRSLRWSFRAAQRQLQRRKWSDMSGTTATVVVHDATCGKLSVAHVGDSTAVVGRITGGESAKTVKAVQLTRDHKPELADEKKRIEQNGGRVMCDSGNYRVVKRGQLYPGLNMSRSLGDGVAHQLGVISEPEVSVHTLDPNDQLVLLASDGIWEVISPQEAMEIAVEAGALESQKKAAEALVEEASRRWLQGTGGEWTDDITVVLVKIQDTNFQGPNCLTRSDTANSTVAPSHCSSMSMEPSSMVSDMYSDEDSVMGATKTDSLRTLASRGGA